MRARPCYRKCAWKGNILPAQQPNFARAGFAMKKETRARAFTAEPLLRARGNIFLETIPVMPFSRNYKPLSGSPFPVNSSRS